MNALAVHTFDLMGWRALNDFELSLDAEAGQSCFNGVQGKGP